MSPPGDWGSARLTRALARRRLHRGVRARPVLTGRALVLGGILVLLVVVLAAPVNRYIQGREAVGQAARQLHRDRAELHRLQQQRDRWSDPGYVQQQARRKLQFAMPGDTVYIVGGSGRSSQLVRTSGPGRNHHPAPEEWNARIWDSVRAAGQ